MSEIRQYIFFNFLMPLFMVMVCSSSLDQIMSVLIHDSFTGIYGANAVSVLQKHYIILLSYIRAMLFFFSPTDRQDIKK